MTLKKLLQGLIIGIVPAFVSIFIWDLKEVTPRVSMPWFITIMAVATAIGLSIALRMWFIEQVDRRFNAIRESFKTGLIWYAELLLIYFIVSVLIYKNPMYKFYPAVILLTIIVVISTSIGYIINDRKQKLTTESTQNEHRKKVK